jgi:transketolase
MVGLAARASRGGGGKTLGRRGAHPPGPARLVRPCRFGASAPAPVLYEKFGITTEAIVAAAKSL